jgi:hypothetical protein
MRIKANLLKWGFMFFVLGLLSACISIPKPQPDLSNPIHTVAILPFANESNNVDAPKQIRDLLSKKLSAKFYRVLPIEEVDQTLVDELGITLGEQLEDVTFKEIKLKVVADAYIFGNITHYDQTTSGVLNTNRVRAILKMVKADDESVFWVSNLGIKSEARSGDLFGSLASLASAVADGNDEAVQWITIKSKTGGDGSILGNLISGMVDKAVDSAFGVTLTEETVAFVNYSTRTLRNGPGY